MKLEYALPATISIVCGILLFLSFPPSGMPFLAWIALIPLLSAIQGRKLKKTFLLSLVCGMIFFVGLFSWILEIKGYTYLHHAFLAVYLGSYFGVFGLLFSFISRRCGIAVALIAAPFVWACLEYARSNFFFLALPWGLLAHSQYQHPLVIQVASVAGVYGVSFLIVTVNAALTALIYYLLNQFKPYLPVESETLSRRGFYLATGSAVVLVGIALIYGYIKISTPIEGKEVKLSLVQGNIAQKKKWNPRYAGYIMKTHSDLTREASKNQPDLIIWPETATPRPINRDPNIATEIRRLVNATNTPLLLGSSQATKFKKEQQKKKVKYKNSAFLIQPKNTSAKNQQYDKISLMPFGEYLPYQDIIPWAWIDAEAIDSYLPGGEYTVFQIGDVRFSVTICWENLFADLVRQYVKSGAQFIVNITNEAWFGETAAPYQFLSMSVFRAVENRIYVMRCANTGISCFIDPCGRVVDRVKDETGKDIFVRGVLTRSVVPLESRTFYTRYGDWLIWLSIACTVFFLILAVFRKPPV